MTDGRSDSDDRLRTQRDDEYMHSQEDDRWRPH